VATRSEAMKGNQNAKKGGPGKKKFTEMTAQEKLDKSQSFLGGQKVKILTAQERVLRQNLEKDKTRKKGRVSDWASKRLHKSSAKWQAKNGKLK